MGPHGVAVCIAFPPLVQSVGLECKGRGKDEDTCGQKKVKRERSSVRLWVQWLSKMGWTSKAEWQPSKMGTGLA